MEYTTQDTRLPTHFNHTLKQHIMNRLFSKFKTWKNYIFKAPNKA